MPYKVARRVVLTNEGLDPLGYLEAGTIVERIAIKNVKGQDIAEVRTREPQVTAKQGWVALSALLPIYGQTERKNGVVVSATDEVVGLIRKFAKELDKLYVGVPDNHHFMIGILKCEDLDGHVKLYAAFSGDYHVPPKWEDAAEAIGCVPAPSLGVGTHIRDITGKIMKPVQPGDRVKGQVRELKARFGEEEVKKLDWDREESFVKRNSNIAGTCAAQKMLQLAFKVQDTPVAMVEQWYDTNGHAPHGVLMESCPTCRANIARMLER